MNFYEALDSGLVKVGDWITVDFFSGKSSGCTVLNIVRYDNFFNVEVLHANGTFRNRPATLGGASTLIHHVPGESNESV